MSMEIYYWSGTGNTLKIARRAGDVAEKSGYAVSITPVSHADPKKAPQNEKESFLVLAMPAHGFTAPWSMIKFAMKLRRGKGTRALSIATRGGAYPGFYLRGLSASASFLIAMILFVKGYRVKGIISIDMPSNWTAIVPGMNEEHNKRFLSRGKDKIETFMTKIISGKRHLVSPDNIFEFISGLALAPLSFVYLIWARFFFAKLFFANNRCNSCGVCAKNCPHNAILMKGKPSFPYWTFKCESCGRCMSYCPKEAVEAGHSVLVMFLFATSIPASLFYLDHLLVLAPWAAFIKNDFLLFLLDLPFRILIIFICYFILYYAIKIPFINTIFTYTTGTHWYRRYHEPGTKLKDFQPEEKSHKD
ncbi:MAG: (4Fe-4S)-binding protein [bacterium]|nr:(4Fe-4S)-binding protein [bacterium]